MKKQTAFIFALVSGAAGVAFLIICFATLASTFTSLNQSGFYLTAPGVTTVNITNTGNYVIWNQTKGLMDGQFKTFPQKLPAQMIMTVVKKPEGTKVPMQTAANMSMQINGTHRVSVAQVTINDPGEYQIEIKGLLEKRALYLDKSLLDSGVGRSMMKTVMAGLAGGFFILLGIGLGIYAFVLLLTDKKPHT